jgi:shikimate kinase
MLTFKEYLEEGINDPAIFKAVFLAGGPGSGKSFVVKQTALSALGFKLINSDPAFEAALKKVGLEATPEDIFSPKGQQARKAAKTLTRKQMELALYGRLGLTIDGTGKDYEKINKQVTSLRKLGYDCAMIFVNTDLETAIQRDSERDRSLGEQAVTKMWKDVQKNIGKFQNVFGRQMYIIDNSTGANWQGATNSAYKRIGEWSKTEPTRPEAKVWMTAQRQKR